VRLSEKAIREIAWEVVPDMARHSSEEIDVLKAKIRSDRLDVSTVTTGAEKPEAGEPSPSPKPRTTTLPWGSAVSLRGLRCDSPGLAPHPSSGASRIAQVVKNGLDRAFENVSPRDRCGACPTAVKPWNPPSNNTVRRWPERVSEESPPRNRAESSFPPGKGERTSGRQRDMETGLGGFCQSLKR
jgi:hypothetical protein